MSIKRIQRKKGVVYVVEAYAPYRSKTMYSHEAAKALEATWLLHPITHAPGRLTLGRYLSTWLAEHEAAPSTLRGYRNIIEGHLIPELGELRLSAFSAADWRAYRAKAAKSGHVRTGGALTARTMLQHYHVLHRALADAVLAGMLARNPLDGVPAPKPERGEAQCFSPDELVTLISGVPSSNLLHIPVLLAAGLGMRRGEVLGLQWRDVDIEAGVVTVRHSLDYARGTAVLKGTKAGSVRVLKLTPGLVAELERHQKRQKALRMKHADIWVDNGLVVCADDGRPYHPDTISKYFAKAVKRLKLRHVTFHGLRHSHATMLLASGVPLKDTSARLGHHSVGITGDLYGHVLPAAEGRIADVVETVLGV